MRLYHPCALEVYLESQGKQTQSSRSWSFEGLDILNALQVKDHLGTFPMSRGNYHLGDAGDRVGFYETENKFWDSWTSQGDQRDTCLFELALNVNKKLVKITLGPLGPILSPSAPFSQNLPFWYQQSLPVLIIITLSWKRDVFLILKLTKSRCHSPIKLLQLLLNHWQPESI